LYKLYFIYYKFKTTSFGRGHVHVGLCPYGMCELKICGAKQKSGLKPPPLVVDSPILANFLLIPFYNNFTPSGL